MTAIEDQARSLFLAALEQAPDQWPAFLDEACGGNTGVRARVGDLLRAHQAMGSIHAGGGSGAAPTVDLAPAERPGTVLGPYKLSEEIGEGGFGVVFMAEQTQPVRRRVALKVLKPGMDTRQVVARFEAERQALALMDHPSIAKVHDGGETGSGRPYFVMELVRGVPLTEFCDHNHLDIRGRLELFIQVCRAVQHAHQKGVIHRDLKPANILVTLHDGVPVPKVIDFGIAKAVGRPLTDRTLFTGFAQLVGTPLYMSPEQAELSGLDVDIYPGINGASIGELTNLSGTVFFRADDGAHGPELWRSDGTVPVANIPTGSLTGVNGTLFFSADDGAHGSELWTLVEDGTQATTLQVSGFPTTVTAGAAGSFTVTARNADGTTNTNYRGTVHFTSTDPQAVLPGDYTFTAADQGAHTFTATLRTAGSQSVTVRDTIIPGGDGTQTGITVNPATASRFTVAGFPSPVTAGAAGGFTVTAWDAYGNRATGYAGTVHFTSSDAQAVLPADYTFTAADAGAHTFTATLKTAGTQWLTAADAANGALAGSQSVTVNAAAASRLLVSAPASVKAGTQFSLTVTVVDAYGNVVTGYRGTLTFRSSDSTAELPKNYTFQATDRGTHTFGGMLLKKKGTQTITVTDTLGSSLTASVLIDVR
jgi:ELWxxDGT repeat protein